LAGDNHVNHIEGFNMSYLESVKTDVLPKSYSLRAGRRVLIIDDDRDMVEAIKFIVESYSSCKCDRAYDAYEALDALCERHYDFVLVDQKLPGLKGSKVLEKMDRYAERDPLIAESQRFSARIPVVLMSGEEIRMPKKRDFKHF